MTAMPALDKEGYLRNLDDWSPEVAQLLAALEDIELTPAHWEVLQVLRQFYARYDLAPNNRALVKAVSQALGPDKGRSLYVMKLFGGTPARTAARIAGLPRPTHCL